MSDVLLNLIACTLTFLHAKLAGAGHGTGARS